MTIRNRIRAWVYPLALGAKVDELESTVEELQGEISSHAQCLRKFEMVMMRNGLFTGLIPPDWTRSAPVSIGEEIDE